MTRAAPARTYRHVDELVREYGRKRNAIRSRLADFRAMWRAPDERLFEEVAFCILATQTKARASDAAVRDLRAHGLLLDGDTPSIARFLRSRVRFHSKKAAYLVAARELFRSGGAWSLKETLSSFDSPEEARAWLAHEVDGFSMKEASHFLRNVGLSDRLAILDRHVLRNLAYHGVIRQIPTSLTGRRYLDIEGRMRAFADDLGWSIGILDLLLWSRETGEVFK